MIVSIEIDGETHKFNAEKGIDISCPVRFDTKQFKAFGAPPAKKEYYAGEDYTVSVESGSGCNCPVLHFSAHLHGTHTECVGHISEQQHILQDVTNIKPYYKCVLISVSPQKAGNKNHTENYQPALNDSDIIITKKMLQQKIKNTCDCLIVRTMPNDEDKRQKNYDKTAPSFFTNEAMQYINALNVQHLLVDTPSVDRLQDDGILSNHHIYWDVEIGSHNVKNPSPKTITEFIYAPPHVKDGQYILTINAGNIRSDAAPSQPILFEIIS